MKALICGCSGPVFSDDERAFFSEVRPYGLILFARNIESPEQVRALVSDFRALVGWPQAPVLIDQEGGRVQRLRPPHWQEFPPAARLGALWARDPLAALRAARLVTWLLALELADLGINVDALPVLDVPVAGAHDVIGDRAYAREPQTVALLARAAIAGLQAAGIAPIIKHIPGHGRARADSHEELPVVDAPLATLRRHDFLPFAALADAPMAMTAHVVYSAIDAANPATTSRTVIADIIRGEIGFDGLLMSDDLAMRALTGPLPARAEAALAAGCDVVLHCSGELEEMRAVAAVCPALSGKSLARARAAVAGLRPAELTPDAGEAEHWRRQLLALT